MFQLEQVQHQLKAHESSYRELLGRRSVSKGLNCLSRLSAVCVYMYIYGVLGNSFITSERSAHTL